VRDSKDWGIKMVNGLWTDIAAYDRQWRQERYGHYVVTDMEGNVVWMRGHCSPVEKGVIVGQVAALLESGRLWAWGRTKEEATGLVLQQAERIRGTRALPAKEHDGGG